MNFLEKIRNSDDRIKKMWLILFSSITMVIVIGLWGLYVNLTIPRPVKEKFSSETSKDGQKNEGRSEKIAEIERTLYAGMIFFKEKLSAKNSILIENNSRNFILEGLEAIPKVQLP